MIDCCPFCGNDDLVWTAEYAEEKRIIRCVLCSATWITIESEEL